MNNKNIEFYCSCFVVGASKSGTSWLSEIFSRHKSLFVPKKKEIHYFNKEGIGKSNIPNPNYAKDINWYHSHFQGSNGRLCIDLSPLYLLSSEKNIYHYNNDAKIIILLRDPSSRSISDFKYRIQKGWLSKNCSFEEAIKKYPEIIDHSLYFNNLLRYVETFGRENVLVILFDEIKEHPKNALKKCSNFLNINDFKDINANKRINVTRYPKYQSIIYILTHIRLALFKIGAGKIYQALVNIGIIKKLLKKLQTHDKIRDFDGVKSLNHAYLFSKYFSEDINNLENFLNIDLNSWKR
jgi:hypothetical protein